MKKMEVSRMESIEGGRCNGRIPAGICAAAFVIAFMGPIGMAIGGPTSLGCLLCGNSIF